MPNPTLTLHHLQRSQSERVLWLLEELSIPYNLEIYKRDPLLAPASMKALHPQGSAPIITDGDLVLAESMAIITYILDKYAHPSHNLTIPPDEPNYTTYIYWLYFVLCTLQPSASTTMMAYFDKNLSDDTPARTFPRQQFQRHLRLIEQRLGESEFLGGNRFTIADIMVIYCFTTHRFFLPWTIKPYPNILDYITRMTSRPAYLRTMDKGDHGLPILNGTEPGEKKALL